MIEVYTQRLLSNSLVRRRYKVTLTDLQGNSVERIVGMYNHDEANDGSEVEAQVLASLKQAEVNQFKSDIEQGVNPFQTRTAQWNTRAELLKPILDDALSKPPTDAIVYNGLPYLANVTDAELMALYSQTQAWVDNVRAKATNLLQAKASMDAYEVVL